MSHLWSGAQCGSFSVGIFDSALDFTRSATRVALQSHLDIWDITEVKSYSQNQLMHSCRFFVSRCILPFIDCVILDFLWSIDSCFLSTKVSTKRTHSTWSSDTAANVEHGVLQTTDKTMKEKQKCNATFTPFTHIGVWHWPWRFKFCLTLTLWKEDGIIGGSNCLITKIISATSWLHLPAKKEETSSLQLPERWS